MCCLTEKCKKNFLVVLLRTKKCNLTQCVTVCAFFKQMSIQIFFLSSWNDKNDDSCNHHMTSLDTTSQLQHLTLKFFRNIWCFSFLGPLKLQIGGKMPKTEAPTAMRFSSPPPSVIFFGLH